MIYSLTQRTQAAPKITAYRLAQTPNTALTTTPQASFARKLKWKPVEGCRPWGLHLGKSGFVSNYVRGLQLPSGPPPGHRRHHHHRRVQQHQPLAARARGRSTARSCLATKGECGNSCKTAPARHRGDAHHVQHTPSLTGAAGQLPPFVASGVLICLSRLGSPIFGRVVPGGGLQPSPFVLRISPTETTSDFLRKQQRNLTG